MALREHFERVDDELGSGPWFNGEKFSIVDAAFATVFRYFEVIDEYANFGFFRKSTSLTAWRERLRDRPSVREAVVDDYHERLRMFFRGLDSQIGRLVSGSSGRAA